MAHHNDHGHSTEQKPVSFIVPIIFGLITILALVFISNVIDSCHNECACAEECSQECKEACAKGDHSKHPAGMSMEECHGKAGAGHGECGNCKEGKECAEHAGHHEEASAPVEAAKDSAAVETTEHTAEPAKEEAHH